MGGGGGAGDGNNGAAGDGGNGGGLIFVIAGKIDGSGKLSADGGIGGSSHGATGTAGDGAGGGGGGGTVVVHAVEIAGTWTITADGGVGGNHTNSTTANEVEGPGGGGGGGYIAVSGGAPTRSAVGALGGTTTVRPSVMSTFPSNGATAGNDGQIDGNADTFNYCGVAPSTTAPVATILTGPTPSTNGSTTSTTATFTFEASEPGITEAGVTLGEGAVALQCKLDSEASVKPCSSGSSGYTASTVLTVGHHTFTVTATDLSGNTSSSVWAWDVVGLGLDGGVLDAQGLDAQIDAQSPALDAGVDGGGLDGSGGEVGPAFLDAQGIDAESDVATSDVSVPGVDGATAKLDVPRDLPGTTNQDTAPFVSVDASVDASATDILLPVLDAGSRSDGPDGLQPLPIDTAGLEALGDATVVVLNPDTAPPNPDLNPDVAPVVIEDASVAPSTKDAAVAPPTDIKVMGSGFCAIASSRSTTSAPFLVMALAALALLRRRRQR
jgi:MYXO-CTERM domain-containing protein